MTKVRIKKNKDFDKKEFKMTINRKQLPIKLHYFFFMAAMGPILPFLPVYGKQLGISPMIFGSITSVLPITFLLAKPLFGFLVDRFYERRKCIFMLLFFLTTMFFILMYFLPLMSAKKTTDRRQFNFTCGNFKICSSMKMNRNNTKLANCDSDCGIDSKILFFNFETDKLMNEFCFLNKNISTMKCRQTVCNVTCDFSDNLNTIYASSQFWTFVLLMSLGSIGFNVVNSITDAICFDVLGENGEMGYGRQRVWGTIGFGISAFLAGWTIDMWSDNQNDKSYTPAFILTFLFALVDILCCKKLELPRVSKSESIAKDVYKLIRLKPIAIFIVFATIVGILDGFIVYFLLWYVEDLAVKTGYMDSVKLIEGLIIAAETLFGEVVFFSVSGKILKKIGFGLTLTFCFLCYGLRFGLISIAPTPWWIVVCELFMQGPTYALCYTTIVAYANKIAPPGTSATVQGIVAGVDDGLGYAIGSLCGGILYKNFGGVITMQILAFVAILSAFAYLALYLCYLKRTMVDADNRNNVKYSYPAEANKECVNGSA